MLKNLSNISTNYTVGPIKDITKKNPNPFASHIFLALLWLQQHANPTIAEEKGKKALSNMEERDHFSIQISAT